MVAKNPVKIPLRLFAMSVAPSFVNEKENFENRELLGDAVLGLSATNRIFTENVHNSEGRMHDVRKSVVCNFSLRLQANAMDLYKYFNFQERLVRNYLPSGTHSRGHCLEHLSDKTPADVMESVCGAMHLA